MLVPVVVVLGLLFVNFLKTSHLYHTSAWSPFVYLIALEVSLSTFSDSARPISQSSFGFGARQIPFRLIPVSLMVQQLSVF